MTWEERVLEYFPSGLEQLILAADPDSVLKNDRIAKSLVDRGFIFIDYTDPVTFRYLYESNYRFERDKNKLIIGIDQGDFADLPFDLLQTGYRIHLQLNEFFPKLSYPVLKHADPEALGRLYTAYSGYAGGHLGDLGTALFILQHVYEVVPSLIKSKTALYKFLLHLHYKKIILPEIYVNYFLSELAFHDDCLGDGFSLKEVIIKRGNFLSYLQQQWCLYIEDLQDGSSKAAVPFNHDDIRVYLDSYFIEGLLQPIALKKALEPVPSWIRLGVRGYEEQNKKDKFARLAASLEQFLGKEEQDYRDWLSMSQLFAEAVVLFYDSSSVLSEQTKSQFSDMRMQLEEKFTQWLFQRFGSLVNLSYIKSPVMVHHIPRHISYWKKKEHVNKVALLVVDGLALSQWIVMKEFLMSRFESLKVDEHTAFAWVPTMTSISRQAIFAGESPLYFKDSIYANYREEQLWKRFWQNEGLRSFHIQYKIGLGKDDLAGVTEIIESPKNQVVGLVIDTVDKMTHGQQLGTKGMLQDVKLWLEDGYLVNLLGTLFRNGYIVYLTSDHGSVEAQGQGRPNQGVLVETKGERMRIYDDVGFLEQISEQYASIKWPGYGLPENMHVLIAETGSAYVLKGEKILSHGGISIEEVMVPFIRLQEEN